MSQKELLSTRRARGKMGSRYEAIIEETGQRPGKRSHWRQELKRRTHRRERQEGKQEIQKLRIEDYRLPG